MIKYVHSTGVSENSPERLGPTEETLSHCTEPWRCWLLLLLCVWSDSGKKDKTFFFGRQQKKRKAKDSFRHVRPSTDLGEFRVRFVDGVRCCVNSVSELLLQKPVGLCCLAYPAIENSGEMCIRKWLRFPSNPGGARKLQKCCRVTKTLNAIVQELNYFECIRWE